jgi:hypothetical protein
MPQNASRLSGGVFHKLSVAEFQALLASLTLQRTIDAVHLHHTWRPRHEDYRGLSTIVGMWKFHTEAQRWSDIAQHLTLAPDGALWTGRHWDLPPASAAGHNGSSRSGPFMIEMIGNFDTGGNPFRKPQRDAALAVLAALVDRFVLPTSAIRFHNEMSGKTCPGSAIDRTELLAAVDDLRGALGRDAGTAAPSPFAEQDDALWHARAFLARRPDDTGARVAIAEPFHVKETHDAEPPEAETEPTRSRALSAANALESAARAGRDVDVALTPEIREALRPHVVNLTRGRFSSTGEFTTTKADVDRMFDEHLPKALAEQAGRPLRIVVYAHGGLVGERDGLGVALKHIDWWRANGVYPIYFIWETDFLTSLLNAISGGRAAAGRDLLDVVDAQIEAAARRVRANSIWADMKHVAELSSAPDGGARYVAERLAQFCGAHGNAVEVHAMGHSAGSNFQSFFLPAALDAGVPSIKTLQLLAPAITVDGFFQTIAPKLGLIGPLTMYTMKDSFEQDDDCWRVYNKSLLYLIHHALEEQRETDLLGLEISVRNDLRLKRLFGLDGGPNPRGHEAVWSVTSGDRRASSESASHGGFDDDPATMNSALRRVLALTGADDVPVEFVRPSRSADVAAWSEGVGPAAAVTIPASPPVPPVMPAPSVIPSLPPGVGRRRALCIGINAYRKRPLSGCVADAQRWAETFAALGFDVLPPLYDDQATRERILSSLRAVIQQSAAGDVVAFQFAGHGTTLPDTNGDEVGGDSPGQDESLCPYDFTEGKFIIDDDLAALFDAAPAGVRITSFIDCCHSGTISRFGVGPAVDGGGGHYDERPRFLEADSQMVAAHLAFRGRPGAGRSAAARAAQRDVLFSACRSTEVAWESGNQGDFTRHATAILRGASGFTNGSLLERIQSAFGPSPRQHPELHPPNATQAALFATSIPAVPSGAASIGAVSAGTVSAGTVSAGTAPADVATILRAIADVMGRQ